MKDYYKILELEKTNNMEEIKKDVYNNISTIYNNLNTIHNQNIKVSHDYCIQTIINDYIRNSLYYYGIYKHG